MESPAGIELIEAAAEIVRDHDETNQKLVAQPEMGRYVKVPAIERLREALLDVVGG